MPPIGSVTGGFGVMMDAVSTCTRLRVWYSKPDVCHSRNFWESETIFRRLHFFGMDRCGFAPHMSCMPLTQNLYDYKRLHSFTLMSGLRCLHICILSTIHLMSARAVQGLTSFSLTKNSLWLTVPLLLVRMVHKLICNNLSRLIVPPMYRSSELPQEPIDGLEPPIYRLQSDYTAIVLYRLSRKGKHSSFP